MVYLTKKQEKEVLRMYVGSIQSSTNDKGAFIENEYLVNFVLANDLEARFIDPSLSFLGSDFAKKAMTYQLDELQILAERLGLTFTPDDLDSFKEQMKQKVFTAHVENVSAEDERSVYHVNTGSVEASDVALDYKQHFENVRLLDEEYNRMYNDPLTSMNALASIPTDEYEGPDYMNDVDALFYAERALNNGDYGYADGRPFEIMQRLGDKMTVQPSDQNLYRVFFDNESKFLGDRVTGPFGFDGYPYGVMEEPVKGEFDPFAASAPLPDVIPDYVEELENTIREGILLEPLTEEVPVVSEEQKQETQEMLQKKSDLSVVDKEETVESKDDELLKETGELEPFDRKEKRVFIDGVPKEVKTQQTGESRYHLSLSLANDQLHPLDAYVKPKLNTANQWYNQREMNRVANATKVPVDYQLEDFDKKAFVSDLVQNKKGEVRLDTNTLKAVSDFDYEQHVKTTKEVQGVYQLWKEALTSTGKALSVTAKETMFRAYRLSQKANDWRKNLKEEYAAWSLEREEAPENKPLKEKLQEWKTSYSDWTRGRSGAVHPWKRLEEAFWKRAQFLMEKRGFGRSVEFTRDVSVEKKERELELD